ncbi:hypothetical protein [Salinarchaeum sp. Harcht-Bsk1]|uniref:hypothetical protein n=1 Tax=Salinarchaeum sp. Harcht-Bsk1 TaxID=1333523 RepID=UPI00118188D7|nr:hypothetical protein [Salinarchaeum sp. Harcht-Bsk1]
MSSAATISRGARGLVLAGAGFLVASTFAAAITEPRSTIVAFGLYGFVLHTIFGKAYGLLPAYFDRDLAVPRAPQLQLPLAVLGTVLLAATPGSETDRLLPIAADVAADAGAVLWAAGSIVFLVTIALTIRDNPTGAETGTSASKADRARLDRIANAAMPIALAYLAIATYQLLAGAFDLPALVESPLAVSHLLTVGTATLLVFAIGARLLPRLIRAEVPDALAAAVLASGALGPALLVGWFDGGPFGLAVEGLLHGAIALLAVAVLGHAVLIVLLVSRAPAPRLGAYGVLAGAVGGVLTVAAGALVGLGERIELFAIHPRLGLLGFLGLTILGVVYHFYPPAVAGDRGDVVAAASLWSLGGGVFLELTAVLLGEGQPSGPTATAIDLGRWLAVVGALAYAGLLVVIVVNRRR